MANILVLYSTTDGHTREICLRLQQVIERLGHRVTLLPIGEASQIEPAVHDVIAIGASIRYGKHDRAVVAFIKRYAQVLETKPSAFFSVNLVARKAAKNQPATNPYMRRFLKTIPWKPKTVAVFAGKLDYPRYSVLDRFIIRLIMRVTGGPTDPSAVVDFTDWEQVEAFGGLLAELPSSASPQPMRRFSNAGVNE